MNYEPLSKKNVGMSQKKVIQRNEEIVELKKEIGQLKRDYEIATFTWHAPVSHLFQVLKHLMKYKFNKDLTDFSFFITSYNQIFIADSPEYVDNNNIINFLF
ncbi:hypothetical protein RhiirA5_433512 [Rhizophagus irregularis]|uniref:Uncharacterized protein n=1 Tax=Rhizophagus irregularis TaxID=588596 RepID=A0A2N0NRN4_9GLOM|nr:hypothetical protein RhiirA5_433512 [Rhizophagus irregularis]